MAPPDRFGSKARIALACAAGLATIALVTVVALVLRPGGLRGRLLGGGATPAIESLAVLPLANLSGDASQVYLVDGIHGELIQRLGQLSGLKRVIARESTVRFRGSQAPLRVLADQLNVRALVRGGVLRAGGRIFVTLALIDPRTEAQRWAGSFERDLGDAMALESEIAAAIAREAGVTLTPEERARLASGRRVRPDTYEAYLQGLFSVRKKTVDGCATGLDVLQQAARIDPSDPLPHEGIAIAYPLICRGVKGVGLTAERVPPARAAALKAISLDEHLAQPHLVLAVIKTNHDFDYAGAGREYRRALELNPNLAAAHYDYAWYQLLVGRSAEGLAEMTRAAELDPLSPVYRAWLGFMYLGQDDDRANAEADKALAIDPDSPHALYVKGCVYGTRKMFAEAIAVDSRLAALDPDWRFALAEDYAMSGRREEALRLVADMEREDYRRFSYHLFIVHVFLGNKEETFRALQAAYDYGCCDLPWMLMDESFAWRSDPRWQELRRRMNLPPKTGE